MKLIKIITLLFIFISSSAFGKEEYYRQYEHFRDIVYLQNVTIPEMREFYLKTVKIVKSTTLNEKKKYTLLAQIESLMGTYFQLATAENYKVMVDVTQFNPKKGYNALKYTKEATYHFTRSVKLSNRAMKKGEFSAALAIRSNSAGQLCILKGLFYTLTHGLGVLGDSSKARKLDKSNVKAMVLYASTKAYPPPIYFGNPKYAIKILNNILKMKNIEKDDYFNIYLALGLSYAKQKKNVQSLYWLKRALKIYPTNKIAGELQRQVKLNIYKR